MTEWRDIRIRKLDAGGFLVALYFPSGSSRYGPPTERAFSTAKELHDWLEAVLGLEENFKEPE